MSNEKHETIADIVADIRAQNQGLPEDSYALSPLVCDLLSFADRIEAAAKREREAGAEAAQVCGEIGEMIGREATREKSSRVGNAAKMLEAFVDVYNTLAKLNPYALHINDISVRREFRSMLCHAKNAIDFALAAPPLNCDRIECATTKAAQDVWNKEDGGKTAYYEWLLQQYKEGESEVEG